MAPPKEPAIADPSMIPGAAAARLNPRPSQVPEPVWQTLLRSYDKKTVDNWNLCQALGYHGLDDRASLSVYKMLDKLDGLGFLRVILRVYDRIENKAASRSFPLVWGNIDVILNVWDVQIGKGVSEGFAFVSNDRAGMRNHFRTGGAYTSWFCEDDPRTTVHGDRDCFRELITAGRGLHVCVARQALNLKGTFDDGVRPDPATFDDIHVDIWQVPSTREPNGQCDYHYATTGFAKHISDAAPWWVGDKADGASNWVKKKTKDWKAPWSD